MKILLTRNADQSGYGGAEEFVLNLASLVDQTTHTALIGTKLPLLRKKATAGGQLQVIESPWISIQSWHGWRQFLLPFYLLWLIRLVAWYLSVGRKHAVDVFHPQNRDDWIAASVAGKIMGKTVIWSDHADLKHEVKNVRVWYKNWQGKLVLWASRFASSITVVSKADLNEIRASIGNGLKDKLTIAYNGIFDAKPRPVSKGEGSFVFGVTARLLRQKGLFELVDAFREINSKHPETELWLVGDGADRAELEKVSASNDAVHFWGYVENPLDHAASFDVFVFPTHTEGFSLSLIEAAMLELPIITTDVGGNPEIITDGVNGLLIPPRNVQALTESMQKLYGDPALRKKLAANARKRFLQEFEFGHLVETVYMPLYNKNS